MAQLSTSCAITAMFNLKLFINNEDSHEPSLLPVKQSFLIYLKT